MPQVARDKKMFSIEQRTCPKEKTPFQRERGGVSVASCACLHLRERVRCLSVSGSRHTGCAAEETVMTSQGQRDYHCLHSNPL